MCLLEKDSVEPSVQGSEGLFLLFICSSRSSVHLPLIPNEFAREALEDLFILFICLSSPYPQMILLEKD